MSKASLAGRLCFLRLAIILLAGWFHGNLDTMMVNGVTTTYNYHIFDQWETAGGVQYHYDGHGNLDRITNGSQFLWMWMLQVCPTGMLCKNPSGTLKSLPKKRLFFC